MKTQVIEMKAFMNGKVVVISPVKEAGFLSKAAISAYFAFIPESAFAADTNGSWQRAMDKALEIADYVDGGLIIYSGFVLMFGNRTRAIELLFGSSVGYIIIRHWQDIQRFIKSF